jgi:hypothetical protein
MGNATCNAKCNMKNEKWNMKLRLQMLLAEEIKLVGSSE